MGDEMRKGPRLLKVHELDLEPSETDQVAVVFQFQDIQQKYDSLLSDAQQDADELVETARGQADVIKKEAYDRARREGLDRGADEIEGEIAQRAGQLVEVEVSQRIGSLVQALEQAILGCNAQKKQTTSDWETTTVKLAIAITEKLLRRELERHPADATAMIATALQLAAGSGQMEVHLHPADLELLTSDPRIRSTAGLTTLAEAELVPDESIDRGGCLVHVGDGEIDARLPTLLDRIAAELLDMDDAA